jgi:hypothetical protein
MALDGQDLASVQAQRPSRSAAAPAVSADANSTWNWCAITGATEV